MKLYLHIGIAKTGTTSLQNFLYLNRMHLAEQGVLYPASVTDQVLILYDNRGHNAMVWNQRWSRCTQRLQAELRASDCSCAILSAEVLQQQLNTVDRIRDLHGWLRQLGFDHTEVIVYLREPGAWFCSYISQLVRNSTIRRYTADDLTQLLPQHFDVTRSILDYRGTVEQWGEVFGQEHLQVRLFERECLQGGDLLRDFMQTLGLEWQDGFQIPDKNANERLNLLEIELFRSLNNLLPGHTLNLRTPVRRFIYLKAGQHLGGTSEPRLRFSPPPRLWRRSGTGAAITMSGSGSTIFPNAPGCFQACS